MLFEADEPDHVEDVSTSVDTKIAALLEHRSQLRTTMDISATDEARDTEIAAFSERIRERLASTGSTAGFAAGEAFKRIDRL